MGPEPPYIFGVRWGSPVLGHSSGSHEWCEARLPRDSEAGGGVSLGRRPAPLAADDSPPNRLCALSVGRREGLFGHTSLISSIF